MPDRLRSALPREIADRIAQEARVARTRDLPAGVLEHHALELAARGTEPANIIQEILLLHRALWIGREALRAGGRAQPTDGEIEAAAAVLRQGADDAVVTTLAQVTPPERSLVVPLFAVSGLMDRGVPAGDVIAAMHVWLKANASDAELHDLAGPTPRPDLSVIPGGARRSASDRLHHAHPPAE